MRVRLAGGPREVWRSKLWIAAGFMLFLLQHFCLAANDETVVVPNGDFESGLARPWGTGQYSEGHPIWWNSGNCRSSAEADRSIRKNGAASLHIVNQSARAPDVFGSTQQPVSIIPNNQYRITLWARSRRLASNGAVEIVVDREWKVRPIHLPQGSYDWTRFSGLFSLPEKTAQLRILSQDRGEAWIDDIEIEVADRNDGSPAPEQSTSAQRASPVPRKPVLKPGPEHYFAPADWVRAISGELSFYEIDLSLPSGFALTRAYSPDPRLSADFGPGWVADWETGVVAGAAEDRVEVLLPDLTLASMRRGSDGAYRAAGSADELRHKSNGGWVLNPTAGGSIMYDDKGRPVEILSPDGAKLRYEREGGLLARIVRPDGTAFKAVRDGSGKIRQINGKEAWASYAYDQNGRLKEFRSSDGWFVQYETDNRGRLIKRVDANGATTHVAYSASDKVEALGAPALGSAARLTFNYGPSSFSVKDDSGQTKSLSSGPTATMQDTLGEKLTIKRDADGRVAQTVDPRGLKVDFLYDELGRPAGWSDSVGHSEKWRWDGVRLVEITDALGRSRHYFYDALGNIATMVDPAGNRIEFSPTPEKPLLNPEALKALPEISQQTSFKPDGSRQKIEFGGLAWRYDKAGRLANMSDYRFDYEPGGLLSKVTGPGDQSVSFEHDTAGREIAVMSKAFGRKRFDYDAGDRLVKEYLETKDQPVEVRFRYDPLDRLTNIAASQRPEATFTYSKDGHTRDEIIGKFRRTVTTNDVGQIISDKEAAGHSVEFTYSSTGALTGWKASDGWRLALARDASGETTNLDFSGPGNRSLSINFARKSSEVIASYSNGISAISQLDGSGKPIQIKWSGKKGPLITHSYAYDPRNFLAKEQCTDFTATGEVNSQREYQYDNAGRLITPLPAKQTHDYDSSGRVATLRASDRTVRFQWDGANQLLSAEGTTERSDGVQKFSFELDAAGNVVAKTAPGTTTDIWRAAGIIHEITERTSNAVARIRFLPGPSGDPVAFVFNDQIYVLVTTPRGDVIGIVADDGLMVNHYQYDDWGAVLAESEKIPQPFLFAGAFYDRELKLYQMGKRWYDPAARRFLTPDPVPDFDPYLYADGDPVNLVDRTGTSENEWLDLVDNAGKPYRHWIIRGGAVMDEQAVGMAQAYHQGQLIGAAEGRLPGKVLVSSQGRSAVFGGRGNIGGSYSERGVGMIRRTQERLLRHVEGLYGRSFRFASGDSILGSVRAGSSPSSTVARFTNGLLEDMTRVPVTELNPGGTPSRFVRFLKPWGERIASGGEALWSGAGRIAGSPATAAVLRTTGRILGSTAGQVGLNLLTSPGSIALDPHEVPLDPSAAELLQRAQNELRAAGLSDKEIEEIWARAGGALGRTNALRPDTSVVPPSEMEKLAGGSIKQLSPIGPEIRSLEAIRQAQVVRGAINASAAKPGARFAAIADAVDSAMVRRISEDTSVADALLARLSYLVQQAEVSLKNKALDTAEQFAREAVANLDSLRALLAAAGKPDRTSELNGRAQAVLARIADARAVVDKALAALESAKIKAGAGSFGAARAVIATALGDRSLFELAGQIEMIEHLEELDAQVADAPGTITSIKAELEKMRAALEKCSTQDWVAAEAIAAGGFSKFDKFDFHPVEVALLKKQMDNVSAESLFAAEKMADLVDQAESLEKTDPKAARAAASDAIKLAATIDPKGRRCADILAARANALIKRLAAAAPARVAPTQAVTILSGSGKVTCRGLPDKRDTYSCLISSLTIDVAKGTFHATGFANGTGYYAPYSGSAGRFAFSKTETVTLDGRYQGDGKTGTLEGSWTAKGTTVWDDGRRVPINYSHPVRGKLENGTVTGELTWGRATYSLTVQVK